MRRVLRTVTMVLMAVFLVAASLVSLNTPDLQTGTDTQTLQNKLNKMSQEGVMVSTDGGVTKVITEINKMPLQDNLDLYQYDDPASVVTMYATIRRGNKRNDTSHTWREVNDATKFFFENMEHIAVPKAEVILQIGDENGPAAGELGYGARVPNGTIQIRGSSTSMAPQKSYKIELFNSAGEWRGQKTIALNKHIWDPTRAKNKLAFDLLKDLPDMASLRTQFVHLYVKDETADPPAQAFEDYGLFTQVEQPNKTFLKNHLLDRYGQLYKAIMFEFFRYPDKIRLADDPQFDEVAFSTVLEVKGSKDHAKLIEMLDAVNNWDIPIEETFEKYFNEDNYFTWMAFNILVQNTDTNAQNFYLYSPQNGQKWYFLPWDYDGSFNRQGNFYGGRHPYEQGVFDYWGVVLHKRVLMVPEYREKLDDKIHEVLDIVTPERVNNLLNIYRPVTDLYVTRMPDQYYYPLTIKEYDLAYSFIPDEMQANYDLYKESLSSPMPFFLGTPVKSGSNIRFNWDEAYDFNNQNIDYHFILSTSPDFEDILSEASLTNKTIVEIPMLEPGAYFWRVVATNEIGKTQVPFDYYTLSDGDWRFGLKYLYISPDGEILEE